jgi:hypothetical protein
VILVTEERSCWRSSRKECEIIHRGVECGRDPLQGVHRLRFRLSVERSVQRNKRN